MPSKTRFLQLINSRRCEHCGSLDREVSLDYLGLCYCTKCLEGHRGLYPYINDPYVMNLMLADSRIAVSPGVYVINVLEDNHIHCGERCGPVITIEAMNSILDEGITITDFFQTLENLPGSEFVSKLQKVRRLAKSKLLWEGHNKHDRRRCLKEGMDIIQKSVNPNWQSYLAYIFENDGETLAFEYAGIGAIVETALVPNGSSKLKQVANQLNAVFDQFMTSDWDDFSFLSNDEEAEPFEALLRNFLVRNKAMDCMLSCQHLKECLSLVETDRFGALVRLVFCNSPRVTIPNTRYIPPHLVEVLVNFIISQTAATHIEHDQQRAIAKYVCNRVWLHGEHLAEPGIFLSDNNSYLTICKLFHKICSEESGLLLQLVIEFRRHPDTIQFVNSRDKETNNDIWINIKEKVVENVLKNDTEKVLTFLRENNYDGIYEYCHSVANNMFDELREAPKNLEVEFGIE